MEKAKVQKTELEQPKLVTDVWDGTFMTLLYDPTLKMREPDGDPEGGEEVVGVMSSLEKRLWSMSNHYKRLLQFEMIAYDDATSKGEKEVHKQESIHLGCVAKVLRELMWALIRSRLASVGCELNARTVGVRAGWKIVAFDDKESPADFLQNLLHLK